MPHFQNATLEQVLYAAAAAILLVVGFQVGRLFTSFSARRRLNAKEQELFTAQKGFKQLYEQEVAGLKAQVAKLTDENKSLVAKTEDYRRKAAGLGGLFNSNGRRAETMYALLLENESLEEALANQNQKLAAERTDSVKEQTRAAGYRRVLMSQLMSDNRIKGVMQEILDDDARLPGPATPALPSSENAN